jgi:hypothetical protein
MDGDERTSRSPALRLRALIDGYQGTCVLAAACRLDLFTRLADTPKDLSTLAAETAASVDGVRRLIRALAAYGLVECGSRGVTLTPDGRLLVRGGGGLGELLELVTEEYLPSWAALHQSIVHERPAFPELFGMSAWEHRSRNPALSSAFNRVTRGHQALVAASVLDACDLSAYRSVVDVGGGYGFLVAGVLARYPSMTAVVFDQPHVVAGARETMTAAAALERCQFVPGSFFDAVPSGADLYVLQSVLHDWDDKEATTILRRCRAAMNRGSTLMILEKVIPENHQRPPLALSMRDLHMMTVLGGRERSLLEYDALAHRVCLSRVSFTSLPDHVPDVIVMRPDGSAGAPSYA